jgi:membrane protease YdiL (CAAX protease family)
MNQDLTAAIAALTEHAREIISGSFRNVDRIFRLTDKKSHPAEIAELAEAFGMMSVKVEAREFALEQKIDELRREKERVEELIRIRTQMASIFINTVLLLTCYTFVIGLLNSPFAAAHAVVGGIQPYIARAIEAIALAVVVRMVVTSGLPLTEFGITAEGWKRAVPEALAVSIAVIAALCLFKIWLNAVLPATFREAELFNPSYFDLTYVTYIVVAPLQEFISRGTVQGTLQRLFAGRRSWFSAILVTSLLFGSLHVYASINLAVAAVLTSWLWGWMYYRQKTLVGVSLSHFLIGNAAGLMGYWNLFQS